MSMNSVDPGNERALSGAVCATHPVLPAVTLCARCGDYACEACTRATSSGALCATCADKLVLPVALPQFGEASQLQRILNFVIDLCANQVLVFGAFYYLGSRLPAPVYLFMYYAICEAATGRTLGKLITGTRVVTIRGERPPIKAIALRTLSRFVPFEAFSFLNGNTTGWHDRWSGTRVVRVRRPA
jgi:hypothetical protein